MNVVLYVVLGLFVLASLYTYFLYPIVLRIFRKKEHKLESNYTPSVTVLIVSDDKVNKDFNEAKYHNVKACRYDSINEIIILNDVSELSERLLSIKGEIVIFTDPYSEYLPETITNILPSFADSKVGCVCGMMRKKPTEIGECRDSANWRYENSIKVLESNINSLSGGNTAILAVRKSLIPIHLKSKINWDFLIPTIVIQEGYDVLFEPKSIAYEREDQTESDLFMKHIVDGASGYRSIIYFWKLLLPHKGSFVFWSHRVLKWLMPFNLLFIFAITILLYQNNIWFQIFLYVQLVIYSTVIIYHFLLVNERIKMRGVIGKLMRFIDYFMVLNLAFFLGALQVLRDGIAKKKVCSII